MKMQTKGIREEGGKENVSLFSLFSSKIVILGVGNILLQDEGIGVHVVRELQTQNLPPNVELIDAGTATLDILPLIEGVSKLVVIDAVKGRGEYGTIYRFLPEEIESEKEVVTSLHQMGLLETLSMLEKMGHKPNSTVIIGIEPKEITWGLELSKEIKEKIPEIIELVLNEVSKDA